jgi:hypothetical protein
LKCQHDGKYTSFLLYSLSFISLIMDWTEMCRSFKSHYATFSFFSMICISLFHVVIHFHLLSCFHFSCQFSFS